ncbi:MAG: hypothetical protein C4320_07850, partial [Armatimonadota bacterium]
MKFQPNPKMLFLASGVVAVAGAGLVYTTYMGLSEAEARVAALRQQARDEKAVRRELASAASDIAVLRAKLRHLEEGVPPFAYVPSMAKELELTGRSHGLEILGVRPMPDPAAKKDAGDRKSAPPYQEMIIAVKARGSYGSVMRFVQSLTTFQKIVAVRMLTLSPKVKSDNPMGAPSLDADIEIRAYVFKDAAP